VHQAAAFAIEFAAADDVRRKVLAAVEQENQKAAAKLRAERRHLREEAEKARAELKSREMEERNAAQKAVDEIAAEKRQIETKLNTTVAEQRAQIAALNEKQKQALAELERKKAAEEAEHNRRYSPDDTVYNLRPLAALIQDGVTTIPPGTELKITGTNENGLLQLKWGALESEAASTILTHDRDLAAQVAAADARNQMTLQQRLEEQRFQQEMQRQKEDDAAMRARPTPVPVQAGSPTPANPLGNPTLFGR
jgi:hypothetical protein